jgi:serine/threonine-protein kinase
MIPALVLSVAIAGLALFAAKHYSVKPASGILPYFSFKSEKGATSQTNIKAAGRLGSKGQPLTVVGRDSATLHLVPGGEMPSELSGGSAVRPEIKPFYMDETLVTNYQFIEFLNDSLSKISVKDNAVIVDGRPWLLLGEVVKGYEPILYRNGKFQLNGAQHASCPVLRVTAHGASAYAGHYGKRLPTQKEWAYAAYNGKTSKNSSRTNRSPDDRQDQNSSHGGHGLNPDSGFTTSVLNSEPDLFGIRGLDGKVAEWGVLEDNSENQEYVALGGTMHGENGEEFSMTGTRRQPWEASDMIGFRTVLSSSR